jgi:hypothetical protein
MRADWLLALAAAGVVAVLVIVKTSSGSGAVTAPSAKPAATAFARGYLRYLDAGVAAARLPYATAQARRQAGQIIPRAKRSGALRLTRLATSAVVGATSATILFVGRDRGHTVSSSFRMRYAHRRWRVVGVVAPDLVTALRPRTPTAPAPSSARRVARAFAPAYVDYVDGASGRRPPGAAPAVVGAARSEPLGRLPGTRVRARLLALRLGQPGPTIDAVARVRAAASAFTFAFVMQRAGDRWTVAEVIAGSRGVRP